MKDGENGLAGRLGAAGAGAVGLCLSVFAGTLVALFVVLMFAGGVYRTECTFGNGQHTTSWGLEGVVPYLWSPDDSHCQTHTLTRYVLGKIGVMGDLDR
ncbi:MAG: hypothetical protein WAL63_13330 [Solirubrobacteraceae bacterium]